MYQAHLDGQNVTIVTTEEDGNEIFGLAIDLSTNALYYTYHDIQDSNVIKKINLMQPYPKFGGERVDSPVGSAPHGISVTGGILYWTELLRPDTETGAIYQFDVNSSVSMLLQNGSINPQDVSSFPDVEGMCTVIHIEFWNTFILVMWTPPTHTHIHKHKHTFHIHVYSSSSNLILPVPSPSAP